MTSRKPDDSSPAGSAGDDSTALAEHWIAIRHDLNNELCTIALHAELLGMALGDQQTLKRRVEAIEETVRKIQILIRGLQTERGVPAGPSFTPAGS